MYETEDDTAWQQALPDRTLARANPHLSSIVSPERRLTAPGCAVLARTKHVAFATANELASQPRVTPLDGRVHPRSLHRLTGGRGARRRHLRSNAAYGATLDGDVVGITAHGNATIFEHDDAGVDEIEPVWRRLYGSSPFAWGDGVVLMRIEPTSMWAYAFRPELVPE